MFTGIVQSRGTLLATDPTPAGRRLTVALHDLASAPISPGDSISVSGVCLTVVSLANAAATFDVITETLTRTSLGDRSPNDRLNLELSLQPTSFLGGHFVQGHIDAVGTITRIQSNPSDWRLTTRVSPEITKFLIPKGSITIEGVSMTIAETNPAEHTFTLAVIPTTLEKTTLGTLAVGHRVNLETDILTRTVIHYLEQTRTPTPEPINPIPAPSLTVAKLIEQGFA